MRAWTSRSAKGWTLPLLASLVVGLPASAFQVTYLKASNTDAGDRFTMVAMSGDTLVVGAVREASSASGVDGNQLDNSMPGAGAAYVFVRSGGAWVQQAYLKASNTDANDNFGTVAISGDTVAIGAYREASSSTGVNGNQADNSFASGAVYVFVRSGTSWSQQAYLKSSNFAREFGTSVSVSGDTIIVGAPNESSPATGVNGNQTQGPMSYAGAAYVFVRAGTTWSQQAYLKASNTGSNDSFGQAVSISGDLAVVGAPLEKSNATGVNGNQNDNSTPGKGAAYVFVRNGGTWTQEAYLKPSNAGGIFGISACISGETIVVGAANERNDAIGVNGTQSGTGLLSAGSAYVFKRTGTTWVQQAYLKALNTGAQDDFGYSVCIDGDVVVVGAPGESSSATGIDGDLFNNGSQYSGAAYVYGRTGNAWTQRAYLKASNTDVSDSLGVSVAVSANIAAVGAWDEDSVATGVGAAGTDNGAPSAGAVYTYDLAVDAIRLSCLGERSGTSCPCANYGQGGRGCGNSWLTNGSQLGSIGWPGASQATDSLTLMAIDVVGPGLFFQSTGGPATGAAVQFGDGLLCAHSSITRLGVAFPTGNVLSYPGATGTSPIHVAGGLAAGDLAHYQCWYRDAGTFCSPSTFNLTNALSVTWAP